MGQVKSFIGHMWHTGLNLPPSALSAYLQELEPLSVALKLQLLVPLEAVRPVGKSQVQVCSQPSPSSSRSDLLLKSTWME